MPPRHRFWIITIIVLFVASFLVAFAPVRYPGSRGPVESTFRYGFAHSLVDDANDRDAKAAEIERLLEDANISIMSVVMLDNVTVEVETAALTDEDVQRDRQSVTKALQEEFEGVSQPQMPPAQQGERPVWQPFDFLAIAGGDDFSICYCECFDFGLCRIVGDEHADEDCVWRVGWWGLAGDEREENGCEENRFDILHVMMIPK